MNKIIIYLLIITTIFISSCAKNEEIKINKYYDTEEVNSGSIEKQYTFIGNTSGETEVNLSTKAAGKITFLSKNVGDAVYKGELIASLDSSEASIGLQTANNIASSLNLLKDSTNSSLESQIKATNEKIKQAEIGITGIENAISNTIKISDNNLSIAESAITQAKIGIKTAETNLAETKNVLSGKKESIIKNAKNAITQSLILDTNIINFTDELLGITKANNDKNDSFEQYLGTKNTILKSDTKILFKEINLLLQDYRKTYEEKIENNKTELNEEEIIKILETGEVLALKIQNLLKNTYDILNASIDNLYFPLSTINSYKAQISTFGSQIDSSLITVEGEYILGLKGSIQNLDSINRETKKAIELLEKQIELAKEGLNQAQKTYESYESNKKMNQDDLETKKEIALKGIEEAKNGLDALSNGKDAQIKEIESKIFQVVGEKNLSATMIENGKIYSPISGIITNKLAEVGQVTGAGMPIYIISSNDSIKVKTDISDKIASELNVGDKLIVNIEGKDYEGIITNLPLIKNIINKRIPIEINIPNQSEEIKVGSKATINIKKLSENKNTLIPNNAIIEQFLVPGVYVLKDKKARFTKIEIVNSNEEYSEVLGLNVGDTIITNGKENIYDGEILN